MKRLIASILALSLVGSSAAMAAPRGFNASHNSRGSYSHSQQHYSGHNSGYRHGSGYGYRSRDNGAALGLGLFALGMFGALAAQDRYGPDPYAYGPPPPAPAPYGYGGYDDGYGGYYGR